LPGTKFYDLVKAQLGGKTHWHESSDLEMMFHGTYTSDFYREIRNLLHEQVSLQAVDTAAGDAPGGDRGRAKRALQQRWHDLLTREGEYRSRPHQPAATG